MKGWYHPKGPSDVPLEVARLLDTVAAAMEYARSKHD